MRIEVADFEKITTALHYHLAHLLGLKELNLEFAFVLRWMGEIANLDPAMAWARSSFLEEYAQQLDLDLASILGSLLRESPMPAFNPNIVTIANPTIPNSNAEVSLLFRTANAA